MVYAFMVCLLKYISAKTADSSSFLPQKDINMIDHASVVSKAMPTTQAM